MASLYIKDGRTADLAAEVAQTMGTTKTAAVYQALLHQKAELAKRRPGDLMRRMDAWRLANPLPAPTGLRADKAFFDAMWGEEAG